MTLARGEGQEQERNQAGIDLRIALSVCTPEESGVSTRVRMPIGSPAPGEVTGSAVSVPRRKSSLTAPEGRPDVIIIHGKLA